MKACAANHLALRNVGEVVANYLNEGMTDRNHKASLKERFDVMTKHYGWLQTVLLHGWFAVRAIIR